MTGALTACFDIVAQQSGRRTQTHLQATASAVPTTEAVVFGASFVKLVADAEPF